MGKIRADLTYKITVCTGY